MFAVFAVCKQHCLARAKRLVKRSVPLDGGGSRELSPEEWESQVQAMAAELFDKSKPRKISAAFEAKGAAVAFKELAIKTREARTLSVRRREHLKRHGMPVLNLKTKKPRFTWVADA